MHWRVRLERKKDSGINYLEGGFVLEWRGALSSLLAEIEVVFVTIIGSLTGGQSGRLPPHYIG